MMLTTKCLANLNKRGVLKTLRKYSKLSYIHKIGEEPLRPLTLGKLLERKCTEEGDKTLLISKHEQQKLSYIEVLNQVDRLAAGLRSIGLNYGDRVGIMAPNSIQWYLTNMACARAGLILVCVNPALQAKEVEYCINKVTMKAIVCPKTFKSQNFYNILNQIAPEIPNCDPGKLRSKNVPSLESIVIMNSNDILKGTFNFQEVVDLSTENGIKNIKHNQDRIKLDEPCHIQFTSGTTGRPKAPIHTHFGLVNNSYIIGKRLNLHRKYHVICVPVPFFHALATDAVLNAGLNHGSTLVLGSPSFDPDKALDAMKDEKCTVIYGTPTMYVDLVECQKKRKEKISPDCAVWGGATASPHLLKEVKKYLNLKQVIAVYGMTECTSVTFQSLPDDDDEKSFTTVGYLSDHLEAKVVDSEGKIVPRGTPGELYVRGFNTTLGFWNDPEKTRELISEDKWLKTGDQFVIDEEGYGHVVGRLTEFIIRGGENIYPREIEDFLNTHPDIVETHVVGVPSERLGEEVCACVRLREGVTNLTLADLRSFCKGNLAHFKIPAILKVVETFPKTQTGKIQKFKLVEMFS